MGINIHQVDEMMLVFLGDDSIPAIGPFFPDRQDAIQAVHEYLLRFDRLGLTSSRDRCEVTFSRQADGRYSLILNHQNARLEALKNLDELMLKRFRKGLRQRFFVVTSFCEDEKGHLECMALTEGLGAVLLSLG